MSSTRKSSQSQPRASWYFFSGIQITPSIEPSRNSIGLLLKHSRDRNVRLFYRNRWLGGRSSVAAGQFGWVQCSAGASHSTLRGECELVECEAPVEHLHRIFEMMTPTDDLASKIARLVQERGWNQEDFARIANLNRHTVRSILQRSTGRRLRNATIMSCARALGLTVNEL